MYLFIRCFEKVLMRRGGVREGKRFGQRELFGQKPSGWERGTGIKSVGGAGESGQGACPDGLGTCIVCREFSMFL